MKYNDKFVFLLLIYLALQFHGIGEIPVFGKNSGIAVWNLALLCSLLISFKKRFTIAFEVKYLFLFAFFLAFIPSVIISNNTVYSISVLIFVLLNIIMFFKVNTKEKIEDRHLQILFDLSGILATLALILFFYYVYYKGVYFGISSVRPGIGYAIDRGVLVRLVGFNGDPNFYAMLMSFPFYIALFNNKIKRKLFLIPILLSIILTYSRSGVAALSLVITYYFFLEKQLSFRIKLSIGIIAGLALGFVLTTGAVLEVFQSRITSIQSQSRFGIWDPVFLNYEMLPFGNGLYIIKDLIGIYSHNTFIDLLYETGYIVLSLFLLFYFMISLDAYKKKNHIFMAWFFTIFMMLSFFSLMYNPIVYLLPALAKR